MGSYLIFAILLAVAIFGGWILKINSGVFAIAFAFLYGIFTVGLSASEVIALWPTKLFITIILITYYFGFSMQNGTMEGIVKRVMWISRKVPPLMPFMLYALNFTLAAIGVGPYSLFTFMAPLVMAIAEASGMHPLIALLIIVGGAGSGAYSDIGQFGITMRNTMAVHGWDAEMANTISRSVLANNALSQILVFVIVYVIFKGYKIKYPDMEKYEPFDKKQKITAAILCFTFAMMLIPPVLKSIMPGSAFAAGFNKISDICIAAVLSILLCLLFRVGDDKTALKMIPMSALILICGVSMLISVGMKAGIVEALSVWAESHVNGKVAPYFLAITASIMSYFASTVNVVIPSLGAVCGGIAAGTGIPVQLCYSYLAVGSGWSAYSPFSSGGAIALSAISNEEHYKKLYKTALFFPFFALAFCLLQILLGVVIR